MSNERILHCWADRYEVESEGLEFGSTEWAELWIDTHESCGGKDETCMLPAGHDGPHEWAQIVAVTFTGDEATP